MRQLATVSAVEALADDLTRRVLDGSLAPGQHLRETDLAAEYGVGRHTLRAAFDALAGRGLLEKQRNRGVFVRRVTAPDLAEIYQLRSALEAEAFRALAQQRHLPPAAVQAVADLSRLDSGSPQRQVVEADLGFHSAIVAGTGNQRLIWAHQALRTELQLLLAQLVNRYATVSGLARQHQDLLALIDAGDPARAEAAIREHLGNATAWLTRQPGAHQPANTDTTEPAPQTEKTGSATPPGS
jgi:DNA-binding GntR family transcriptional regulator